MTVAIPEAATVAAADTGGAAASSRAPARMSRPTPAQMGRAGPPGPRGSAGPRGPRTVTATPVPGQRAPARQRPAPAQRGGKQGKSKKRDRPNELARRITGAATRPGGQLHNYQAIVAAEFVAASLLVALTPIASRKATASASSGALSPYVPADLIQLVAIGIVYLILEGLAAGPRGLARFSAWFGFLILLGVGLFEASRIAALFKMLAGADVSSVTLTGKAAPATKGETPIPPMAAGSPTGSTKPKG
jgi:hypothetical protein